MSIAKQIERARSYLPGNPEAYARALSAAHRSAASERAQMKIVAAIAQDKKAGLFSSINGALVAKRAEG